MFLVDFINCLSRKKNVLSEQVEKLYNKLAFAVLNVSISPLILSHWEKKIVLSSDEGCGKEIEKLILTL